MSLPAVKLFRDYIHLAKLYYSGAVFVAFDTETTGLHAESDHLIEIGAVKFTCDGKTDSFDALIKPPVQIPYFLTELTHISNQMVENCPCAAEVLPKFLNFLGGKDTVLLAHNAPFDMGFINSELERISAPPLKNLVIDTLPLARWAYPKLIEAKERGQYKLQSLAKRFNVQVLAAHRADDDARVLLEVFERILKDTMSVQKDYVIPAKPVSSGAQLELF